MDVRRVQKLAAPGSVRLVRRTRVVTAIDRALRSGICWIAAPAGYGKTTALIDYLQKTSVRPIWYSVDEGDQDVASFFHYLSGSRLNAGNAGRLPAFGPEYADQPGEFARRFFRAYFERMPAGRLPVFDDLHRADVAQFRALLAILLRELPAGQRCVCLSRDLPPEELTELVFRGRLAVIDQSILQFSTREAQQLVARRLRRRRTSSVDVSAACGWAAGLVLIADSAPAGLLQPQAGKSELPIARTDIFTALARHHFDTFTPSDQDTLLKLSLLPEITLQLAQSLADCDGAPALLARLHRRQLLNTRVGAVGSAYQLHDLLREFLASRLAERFVPAELAALRMRAAQLLDDSGHFAAGVELALSARAWPLARALISKRAEVLLTQGCRATLIDWCGRLPHAELDGWLCYWLGVAHMGDDAAAELWLTRAWQHFAEHHVLNGQCLTAARAVLAKTDGWRTHEGLAAWTQRVLELTDRDLPLLSNSDQLLAWSGMLRAVDLAPDYRGDSPAARSLTLRLLERLALRTPEDTCTLRVIASRTLIEHAGATGRAEIFERSVDSVLEDLEDRELAPWALGIWLVAFGSVTSRCFSYTRRSFRHASPEDALRAALAIGKRESLRGVEFGALYRLQLLLKMRNDWAEFGSVITRIAQITDSRHTTQVAATADCEAAWHTVHGRARLAQHACERLTAAVEAATTPPACRWTHLVTQFEVLLASGETGAAAEFLAGQEHHFAGALLERMQLCVLAARALDAKARDSARYGQLLRQLLQRLRIASWHALLINLPAPLAQLCADSLSAGIEPDHCRRLIARRRLTAPPSRPAEWPWPLRIHVLGSFRLELDGQDIDFGSKTPTRSLDILRALAVARDRACALEQLYDWLWPEADGGRAKAACEQALHRLRKLLGPQEFIVQREGRLRLSSAVWIDFDDWERQLVTALRAGQTAAEAHEPLQRAFHAFAGPLVALERPAPVFAASAERIRGKFIDLAERCARSFERLGDLAGARATYLRAIDLYPTSVRCYEGLIRNRLARQDGAGALEDYARYVRIVRTSQEMASSATIRALVQPLMSS
jgi:LuxR family transcriptional regulator, maltose regulon positive regulatory protein